MHPVEENALRDALKRHYINWWLRRHPKGDAEKELDVVIKWLKAGPHYSERYFRA